MKRIILLFALLSISIGLFSCGGGGGSGSADVPPGENPGIPSVVQLWPSHYIAQTNAYITLYAKVLDGNGAPVPNIDVSFTNLSGVGTLSKTSAKTDGTGLATTTISSTAPGFSTILAQINTAAGVVRDRKSVFFSLRDVLSVSMDMDVDSVPGNGTFNEASDFILFENASDDTFKVRAKVFDAGGNPVAGTLIDWSASHGEVTFVRTDPETNSNGQADGVFKVEPSSIRNTDTTINIMASAVNGAANMVTLFVNPVTISSISVTASPTTVEVDKESTIVAAVTTSIGTPAPNGTVVNFTANCGLFTPTGQMNPPFYQITLENPGMATSTFKAPSTPTTCEIKATSGGVTGSVFISVIPPPAPAPEPTPTPALNVVPADATVGQGGGATYIITGGTGPYTVTTNYPGITLINGATPPVTLGSGVTSFTVTNTYTCGTDTTVTITVLDSAGSTKTATYKIDCP